MADMDMYATVLQNALAQGKHVAPGVHLYLQFGSQKIKQYARERGYIQIFEEAGAELDRSKLRRLHHAGPGASKTADTVTVSAQNRNFPVASGPGKLYLASPMSSLLRRLPERSSSRMSSEFSGTDFWRIAQSCPLSA